MSYLGDGQKLGLDMQHSEVVEDKIVGVVFHFQVCLFFFFPKTLTMCLNVWLMLL